LLPFDAFRLGIEQNSAAQRFNLNEQVQHEVRKHAHFGRIISSLNRGHQGFSGLAA
jgi:hypothetical protein